MHIYRQITNGNLPLNLLPSAWQNSIDITTHKQMEPVNRNISELDIYIPQMSRFCRCISCAGEMTTFEKPHQ